MTSIEKKQYLFFFSLYILYCNLDCLSIILFSLYENALKKTHLWLQGSSTKAQHRRGTSVSSCQACREDPRTPQCSISTVKVKTTNTPAGGYPQRDQLRCVLPHTRKTSCHLKEFAAPSPAELGHRSRISSASWLFAQSLLNGREIAQVAAESKHGFTVSPEKSREIQAAVPNN